MFAVLATVVRTGWAGDAIAMRLGDAWIYSATIGWTGDGAREPKQAKMKRVATVIDAVAGPQAKAYVIHDSPTRLAWFDPSKAGIPAFDVLVHRQDGIWTASAESKEAAHDLAVDAVNGAVLGEQLLRLPLRSGDCVGGETPRDDGMYCWLLTRQFDASGGVFWRLTYSSLSDEQAIEFSESKGITRYEYRHHGTLASARADLIRRETRTTQGRR